MLNDRVIVALDTHDEKIFRRWVRQLSGVISYFKVGSELFSSLGPRAVGILKEGGARVFLDLKFHDIPTTVARAVRQAARMGVDMVNVHASGGRAMMRAAREALKGAGRRRPLLLAVTVLTSLDAKAIRALGVRDAVSRHVARLARLAQNSGCDGVVASAQEIPVIRKTCGKTFKIVTPGVRLAGESAQDQVRVADPREAFRLGADYVVMGRSLTGHRNPRRAAAGLLEYLRHI